MFRSQLTKAIDNGNTYEIDQALTAAIKHITTIQIDDLDQFIQSNILPAYENKASHIYYTDTNMLLSHASTLTRHEKFKKMSKDNQHFFEYFYDNYFYFHNDIKALARKSYQPAVHWILVDYRNIGSNFRERAQILMQACLLMMKTSTSGFSKSAISQFLKTRASGLTNLEKIANDKTTYDPTSKKYAYRRLAQFLLAEIKQLNGKTVLNPISYILAKLKNNKFPEGEGVLKDVIHALKDAFNYGQSDIQTMINNATDTLEQKESNSNPVVSNPLPTLELNAEVEKQLSTQAKLLLYSAFLLKNINHASLLLADSVYYKYIVSVLNDDKSSQDLKWVATWYLDAIDMAVDPQKKPVSYLLEKATLAHWAINLVVKGKIALDDLGIQIDEVKYTHAAQVTTTPEIQVAPSKTYVNAYPSIQQDEMQVDLPVLEVKKNNVTATKTLDLLTPDLGAIEFKLTGSELSLSEFEQLINQKDDKLLNDFESFTQEKVVASSTAQIIKNASLNLTPQSIVEPQPLPVVCIASQEDEKEKNSVLVEKPKKENRNTNARVLVLS